MSLVSCDCSNPSFPIMGRPNCVIEMAPAAFPILVPRFKADGTRNTIDITSATLGADIKALIQTATPVLESMFPFPKMENITFDRTETVYETAPSTKKYKIDGVGGVYTFKGELWGKEAIHSILRELEKVGCSEVDVYFATVDGNLWGVKDNPTDTVIRGYEVATETFDAFKSFATDTTTQKVMVSFDLENTEAVSSGYVITSAELGYSSSALKPLIAGYQVTTNPSTTTIVDTVFTNANGAIASSKVKGLIATNFVVKDVTAGTTLTITTAVENVLVPGEYLITLSAPLTATNVISVEVSANGYSVSDSTFTA